MAMKPIHHAALSRRASTREAVWPIIRAFEGEFMFRELLVKTNMHESSVRDYLKDLIRAGFVAQTGYKYRLIKDNGRESPRINRAGEVVAGTTKSEAIWRAARILGEFEAGDILIAAAGLETPIRPAYVQDYLSNLCKAGYLRITRPSTPLRRAKYRFLNSRYTGPKPPKIQRSSAVFDANLGRVVWQSPLIDWIDDATGDDA